MHYLYGDSTPCPLKEDGLQLLRAVTETCVELLRLDRSMAQLRAQLSAVKREADEERGIVQGLAERALRGLEDYGCSSNHSAAVTRERGRLAKAVKGGVAQARQAISERASARDAEMIQALATCQGRVVPVVQSFLLKHELPETRWAGSWEASSEAGRGMKSVAVAVASCGLEMIFAVPVPSEHLLSRPIRVSDLGLTLSVHLPRPARWYESTAKARRVVLDRYVVTRAEVSEELQTVVLRRSARGSGGSLQISRQGAGPEIRVHPVGPIGLVEAPAVLLAEEASEVGRLLDTIGTMLCALRAQRTELQHATFRGTELSQCQAPAPIAETLLKSYAPIVRPLVERSPARGEVSIKRSLGGMRREESFLPKAELLQMIRRLPPNDQRCFAQLGLVVDAPVAKVMPLVTPESGDGRKPRPVVDSQAAPLAVGVC